MTSALYFADRRMKTSDNYFVGFPAIWNVAAFYLLVLEPPAPVGALAIVALAVLTFLPWRFVHPVRVPRWRRLTVALVAVWAVLAVWTVFQGLAPAFEVKVALASIGVYVFAVGIVHSLMDLKTK
jgi:phosphatidylcholine synthase